MRFSFFYTKQVSDSYTQVEIDPSSPFECLARKSLVYDSAKFESFADAVTAVYTQLAESKYPVISSKPSCAPPFTSELTLTDNRRVFLQPEDMVRLCVAVIKHNCSAYNVLELHECPPHFAKLVLCSSRGNYWRFKRNNPPAEQKFKDTHHTFHGGYDIALTGPPIDLALVPAELSSAQLFSMFYVAFRWFCDTHAVPLCKTDGLWRALQNYLFNEPVVCPSVVDEKHHDDIYNYNTQLLTHLLELANTVRYYIIFRHQKEAKDKYHNADWWRYLENLVLHVCALPDPLGSDVAHVYRPSVRRMRPALYSQVVAELTENLQFEDLGNFHEFVYQSDFVIRFIDDVTVEDVEHALSPFYDENCALAQTVRHNTCRVYMGMTRDLWKDFMLRQWIQYGDDQVGFLAPFVFAEPECAFASWWKRIAPFLTFSMARVDQQTILSNIERKFNVPHERGHRINGIIRHLNEHQDDALTAEEAGDLVWLCFDLSIPAPFVKFVKYQLRCQPKRQDHKMSPIPSWSLSADVARTCLPSSSNKRFPINAKNGLLFHLLCDIEIAARGFASPNLLCWSFDEWAQLHFQYELPISRREEDDGRMVSLESDHTIPLVVRTECDPLFSNRFRRYLSETRITTQAALARSIQGKLSTLISFDDKKDEDDDDDDYVADESHLNDSSFNPYRSLSDVTNCPYSIRQG